MSNRISYSQATQTGKMVAQAVHQVLNALADLRRVNALLDRAQHGDPADWAAVAVELGLPANQDGADAAQAAWTILATALGVIDVNAVRVELARLDQG